MPSFDCGSKATAGLTKVAEPKKLTTFTPFNLSQKEKVVTEEAAPKSQFKAQPIKAKFGKKVETRIYSTKEPTKSSGFALPS